MTPTDAWSSFKVRISYVQAPNAIAKATQVKHCFCSVISKGANGLMVVYDTMRAAEFEI